LDAGWNTGAGIIGGAGTNGGAGFAARGWFTLTLLTGARPGTELAPVGLGALFVGTLFVGLLVALVDLAIGGCIGAVVEVVVTDGATVGGGKVLVGTTMCLTWSSKYGRITWSGLAIVAEILRPWNDNLFSWQRTRNSLAPLTVPKRANPHVDFESELAT
jgi:hypothetical protein